MTERVPAPEGTAPIPESQTRVESSRVESQEYTSKSQCADKTASAECSTVSTVKIAARQRLSVGAVCRLERRRCRKRRSYWSRSVPGERRQGTTGFDVVLEVSAERQHEERRSEEDRERSRASGRDVRGRERERGKDRMRESRTRRERKRERGEG